MKPAGFVEVKRGKIKKGDWLYWPNNQESAWANGLVGCDLCKRPCKVFRRPLKKEVAHSTSDNNQMDAIALVCEVGKLIDDKGDLPLWAYRNQARIRTVCIAQQHT